MRWLVRNKLIRIRMETPTAYYIALLWQLCRQTQENYRES